MKILELFGGIGACSKALERLGIDFEIADYVEIDKYAVKSFNAIHNTNFEPQDIREWNKDIKVDLVMHGSPCQDFSLAGKQAGGDIGSGTRSSLMYETIRIVGKLRPKYVIWENVKNLLSKKHKHNFDAYLQTMEALGYKNYYQVLNAKDYGIPQNRERVFTISILDGNVFSFPKGNDCDNTIKVIGNYMPSGHEAGRIVDEDGISPTIKDNHGTVTAILQRFEFPPKQELNVKLKDLLENEVDGKYYLSDKMIEYISATGTANFKNHDSKINLDIARPLTTDQNKRAGTTNYLSDNLPDNCDLSVIRKYGIFDDDKSQHQAGSVYDKNGLSPTLDTMQGGWRQPCIEIKNATKQGYLEAHEGDSVNLAYPTSNTRRGRVGKEVSQTLQCNDSIGVCVIGGIGEKKSNGGKQWYQQDKIYDNNIGLSLATTANPYYQDKQLRIRKLTPKECWRLMGFDDEDFDKASQVNSNTQLYKQAGNSIVVNVLEAIFKELLLNE